MLTVKIIDTGSQNAYLLDNGETKLQIDMGVPFKQLKELPDYVIYSHQHFDHFTNEKTYRKKLQVIDFKVKNEAKRLGSYYIQSIPMRHGKEWVNGFIIRDLIVNEIYIFAIDFSEYRELPSAANLFSRGYNANISLIMCELHHSAKVLETKSDEVNWAARRHCSDELFIAFMENFEKNAKRKVIALHTNDYLFDFHSFKPTFNVGFAKAGKIFHI